MQALGGGNILGTEPSISLYVPIANTDKSLYDQTPDPKKGLIERTWPATRVRLYDVPNSVYRCAPVPFVLGNASSMQAITALHNK